MFASDYRGGLNVQKALSSRHLGPGGVLEPGPVSRRYAFRSRCMGGLYGLISGPRDATVGVVSSAQSDSCRYHAWAASRPETCWECRSAYPSQKVERALDSPRCRPPRAPGTAGNLPAVFTEKTAGGAPAVPGRTDGGEEVSQSRGRHRRSPTSRSHTPPAMAPPPLPGWRTPAERRRPWTRRPSSLQIVKELKGEPTAFSLQGEERERPVGRGDPRLARRPSPFTSERVYGAPADFV